MANFRFPVYQIDFTAVAAGKRVAATKRRIRWRFGYPNLKALEEGRSGTDCRGEEHEVVIVWSITSGKRQILMDGREIHYSATRTGIIDHSWSSKGNHVLKVVCHAAPPMSANPGFRQYDLFIDGQSFFTMPKVYELGVKGSGERMPGRNDYSEYTSSGPSYSTPRASIKAPTTREQEDEDLQRAINASLEESRQHLTRRGMDDSALAPAQNEEVDLFDVGAPAPSFSSPPPPQLASDQSVMSYMSAPPTQNFASPPPSQPYGSPPPQAYQGAPPQQQQSYPGAPPPPPYQSYPGGPPPPAQQQSYLALPSSQPAPYGGGATDASLLPSAAPPASYAPAPAAYGGGGDFAPAMHSTDDPFAPKAPTHNDIASQILKGYSAAGAAPAQYPAPITEGVSSYAPNDMASTSPQQQQTQVTLSMNGLAITSGQEEENLSDLERAMRKLVNVDHIDEPAEEQIKLTMKKKEEEEASKKKHKSKPLPPAAKNRVGTAATLNQISEVKPKITSPKEGIMKAPPQPWSPEAAAAGMLVVHGLQQNGGGGGPPPLAPRGFGVVHGQAHSYAYGQPQMAMSYGQQQQQQQMLMPPQQQMYPPQQQGYQYR